MYLLVHHLWLCRIVILQSVKPSLSPSCFMLSSSLCWMQVSLIDILKWFSVHRMGQYVHTVRTALVVLPRLLIDISQIYTSNTGANLGKETNKLNSAKQKRCWFDRVDAGKKRPCLSVCVCVCVCVFCLCVCYICVCV